MIASIVVPCNVLGRHAVRCVGVAATLGKVESSGHTPIYYDTSPTPIDEKNV